MYFKLIINSYYLKYEFNLSSTNILKMYKNNMNETVVEESKIGRFNIKRIKLYGTNKITGDLSERLDEFFATTTDPFAHLDPFKNKTTNSCPQTCQNKNQKHSNDIAITEDPL